MFQLKIQARQKQQVVQQAQARQKQQAVQQAQAR